MTYFIDDTSLEDSQPRDGIEIILPSVTYRIATGDLDLTFNGNVFKAEPGQRGQQLISRIGDPSSMTIKLPVSHPLCQRYLANGIPPQRVQCNVYSKQLRSGGQVTLWSGVITSMAIDQQDGHDEVATFLVLSRLLKSTQRKLPVISLGQDCVHILYDSQCRKLRGSFTIQTTVTALNGALVTVASVGGNPDQWFQFGDLVHVASGEPMTIASQVGTVITLHLPLYELQFGDTVAIAAGCTHDLLTCKSKFNNVVNFGGAPRLPLRNPFIPNGYGIYQSE